MAAIKKFHLAFGVTTHIKTLSHENLGKKLITDTKNFVHEIVYKTITEHGIVQNCGHI
jgi:hypothetical protein